MSTHTGSADARRDGTSSIENSFRGFAIGQCNLTFELSGPRRPQAGVGPLERGVRRHFGAKQSEYLICREWMCFMNASSSVNDAVCMAHNIPSPFAFFA